MFRKPYEAEIRSRDPEGLRAIPVNQGSEIPSGASRFTRLLRSLADYYTGTPDGIHSPETEAELFRRYHSGELAKQDLESIDEQILTIEDTVLLDMLVTRRHKAAQRIKIGQRAMQEIIEVNARFAAFMARASVGIPVQYRSEKVPYTERDPTQKGTKKRKSYVGTYANIAELASPYAELEDRIQNGIIGLMMAIRKFKNPQLSETQEIAAKKKPEASFTTFAAWRVQLEIDRGRATGETIETLGPRVPVYIQEEISSKRKFYDADDLRSVTHECTKREGEACEGCREQTRLHELQQWDEAQYHISIDDISFPHAALEEVWNDTWEEPPALTVADVWSDSRESGLGLEKTATYELRNAILSELQTLSSREADVIRLRFGLVDGVTRTFDEIAPVYGVTRDRIRQILNDAMKKLRHPTRVDELRSHLKQLDTPIGKGSVHTDYIRIGRPTARKHTAVTENEGLVAIGPAEPTGTMLQPDKESLTNQEAYAIFEQLLLRASVHNFQKSFATTMRTPYPKAIYNEIENRLGTHLMPQHIEEFWNTNSESWLRTLELHIEDDLDLNRIGQLISALLKDRMQATDSIRLRMPNTERKVGYIGAWALQGEIIIEGDAGDYIGVNMAGQARISVLGNVANYAALGAKGQSHLEVTGNAGDYLAQYAGGEATVLVSGAVGDKLAIGAHQKPEIRAGGLLPYQPQVELDPPQEVPVETITHVDFNDACIRLGLHASELEDYLRECGYPGPTSLTEDEIATIIETFPELQIPRVPNEGYASVVTAAVRLGFRGTPKQFERNLRRLGFEVVKFRDEKNEVKSFISNEYLH